MTQEQRKLIWESMLSADMQTRYWGKAVARRERLELWLTVAVTVLAVGTVSTWIGRMSPEILQASSVLTAATSTALTLLKLSGRLELMANIAAQCNGILSAYERLWAALPSISDGEALEQHKDLQARGQEVYKHAIKIHTSDRRVSQTQREVLRARGLQAAS